MRNPIIERQLRQLVCGAGLAVGLIGGMGGPLWAQTTAGTTAGTGNQEGLEVPGIVNLGDEQPDVRPGGGQIEPVIEDDMVRFSAFSEAMDLVDLVDMVASILEINVNIDPALSGQVMFNTEFSVPRDRLLDTLDSLLGQNGFLITQDLRTGFYKVLSQDNPGVNFGVGDSGLATTRLIPTDSIRPTALRETINALLGLSGGQGGSNSRIAYLDGAGLIAVSGSSGRIEQIQAIVDAVISEYLSMEIVRFELVEIAAPVAREHIISIVTGEQSSRLSNPTVPNRQTVPNQLQGSAGPLDSIPDRLRVDPVGNALLFRGRPEELAQVQTLLALIDKPSTLSHKRFFTGSATMSVAQFASSQGLGDVVSFEQFQNQQPQNVPGRRTNPQQNFQGNQRSTMRGGPVLVVDEQRGFIIHYATNAQHRSLEQLVEQLDAPSEEVVIRTYKLEHAVAIEVADLLTGIFSEQNVRRDENGSLLPPGQGGQNQVQRTRGGNPLDPDLDSDDPNVVRVESSDDVYVVADESHNQVLVKSSVRQQREVAKLIDRLDIRHAQVFLDVKIVSITDTDTFRLAVESQLMNAGGSPVGQTSFGLTTAGAGGILDPRLVNPGLAGLTTAVILSDQLPFVLNAIQSVTDAKVLANPTLLVNDNADGSINDVRQEPFTQRTIGDGGVERQTTEFAEAGTVVEVTPRISSGGYLTLEYSIDFSNFIGEGDPPPINRRVVNSVASLPSDSTMVLGGITLSNTRNTIIKVPILGSIPIIGTLFRDTSTSQTESLLYIFITPRILKDRSFAGHRLIAEGPMKIAEIAPDAPPLEPTLIPILERRRSAPTGSEPPIDLGGDG